MTGQYSLIKGLLWWVWSFKALIVRECYINFISGAISDRSQFTYGTLDFLDCNSWCAQVIKPFLNR